MDTDRYEQEKLGVDIMNTVLSYIHVIDDEIEHLLEDMYEATSRINSVANKENRGLTVAERAVMQRYSDMLRARCQARDKLELRAVRGAM